jgi:tRNA 2-selenouridine synthase SelU
MIINIPDELARKYIETKAACEDISKSLDTLQVEYRKASEKKDSQTIGKVNQIYRDLSRKRDLADSERRHAWNEMISILGENFKKK